MYLVVRQCVSARRSAKRDWEAQELRANVLAELLGSEGAAEEEGSLEFLAACLLGFGGKDVGDGRSNRSSKPEGRSVPPLEMMER